MRSEQPKWTVGFNWMPFNADADIYPDSDSWVGTGMCFFDSEEAADEFYKNILPATIGTAASFKRPFHQSDWERVGADHKRPQERSPHDWLQKNLGYLCRRCGTFVLKKDEAFDSCRA